MRRLFCLLLIIALLTACNLAPSPQSRFTSVTIQPSVGDNILLPTPDNVLSTDDTQNMPFSRDVEQRMEDIFAVGQTQANRANIFSKVGDSITVSQQFLHPIGTGRYNLRDYGYLQATIDFFSQAIAHTDNSFANTSLAAAEGWAAWAALSTRYTDAENCFPSETPLACEYRIVRPSVAIILYGTNDAGYRTVGQFNTDLRGIVDYSIAHGVIPVLTTTPMRPDVAQQTLAFNDIIRAIASEYQLPYIDYFAATQGLPNFGLTTDNVHPSTVGYRSTADFTASNLQYGYTMRNLVTLDMLEAIRMFVLAD